MHDDMIVDARQVDRFYWKTNVDLRKEEYHEQMELMEHNTQIGSSVNGYPMAFLWPN